MGEEPTTVRAACDAQTQRALRAIAAIEARLADEHVPRRPEWECQTCEQPGTPWPCPPAQVRLFEAYRSDRVGLANYVGNLYYVARAERPTDDEGELYDRIVGWIR